MGPAATGLEILDSNKSRQSATIFNGKTTSLNCQCNLFTSPCEIHVETFTNHISSQLLDCLRNVSATKKKIKQKLYSARVRRNTKKLWPKPKSRKPKARRNPFSRPVLDGQLVWKLFCVIFVLLSLHAFFFCFLKVSMNESL